VIAVKSNGIKELSEIGGIIS